MQRKLVGELPTVGAGDGVAGKVPATRSGGRRAAKRRSTGRPSLSPCRATDMHGVELQRSGIFHGWVGCHGVSVELAMCGAGWEARGDRGDGPRG
jgi:hypothetical protein